MTNRASAVSKASGLRAEAGLAKTRAVIAAGALGLAMMLAPAVSASAEPGSNAADKTLVCHFGDGAPKVIEVGDPATDSQGHSKHPGDFFQTAGQSDADFRALCAAAGQTPSSTTTTTTTTTTTSAPATSTTTEPSQTSTTTEPSQTSTTSTTTEPSQTSTTSTTTEPSQTSTTSTTTEPSQTSTTTSAPVETTTTSAPVETTTTSAPVTTTTSAPVQTTTTDAPDTGAVDTSTVTTHTTRSVTVAASTVTGVETAAQAKKLAYTGSSVWHPLTLAGAMLFIGALLLLGRRHLVVERRH